MACRKKDIRLRRNNNSGFTLVEVLIATLIMVLSIVTVTAAVRQFTINREKLRSYEQLYDTVLSLRDRIMNDTLSNNFHDRGKLNGLDYSFQCRQVESANNYVYTEDGQLNGNTGHFAMTLYKVTLEVGGKTFEFHKTQYKKRFQTGKDDV
jgi:type II secretory pathway component PulJ